MEQQHAKPGAATLVQIQVVKVSAKRRHIVMNVFSFLASQALRKPSNERDPFDLYVSYDGHA